GVLSDRSNNLIRLLWDRHGVQSVLSPRLPEVSDATDSAARAFSSDGETPDSDESMLSAVNPQDLNSEPNKATQERRRKRRKPLPVPPIPTFIMVSPGRYIRAEEPSSLSGAAVEGMTTTSGRCTGLNPGRSEGGEADLSQGQAPEEAERIG